MFFIGITVLIVNHKYRIYLQKGDKIMNISKKTLVMLVLVMAACCWQLVNIDVKAEEISGEVVTTQNITGENSTTVIDPTIETTTEEITTVQEETTTKTSNIVKGYSVTKKGKVLKCTYSGKKQKNVYLAIVKENGKYKVTSQKTKGAYIYYFNENGNGNKYKKTNIVSIKYKNKSTKYYVKNGKIGTGWYKISGKKFYYSSGKMVTGWKKISGNTYYFSKNKENEGQLVTDTLVNDGDKSYYVDKSGKLGTAWYKKGSKKYYYSSGKMVTGWKKISGKTYYFSKDKKNKGELVTSTIVDDGKKSYYVDDKGIRVNTQEMNLAVKFVQDHTKESWSKSKKLKACYDYLWKNYPYERFYESPSPSKMPSYARYMLKYKQGNCYRYAAAFAYIARVIGYESRVGVGEISAIGGGMTPHGWTEIKIGGTWYMFDANMQRNYPHISSYKQTHDSYRYRHTFLDVYKLEIKNGKVTWK